MPVFLVFCKLKCIFELFSAQLTKAISRGGNGFHVKLPFWFQLFVDFSHVQFHLSFPVECPNKLLAAFWAFPCLSSFLFAMLSSHVVGQNVLGYECFRTKATTELRIHCCPQLLIKQTHLILVPLILVGDQQTGKLELLSTESAIGAGRGLWLVPAFLHCSNLLISSVIGSCVKFQNVLSEKQLRANVTGKLGIRLLILKQLHLILVPFLLVSHQNARILELFSTQLAIRVRAWNYFRLSFYILDITLGYRPGFSLFFYAASIYISWNFH